MEAEEERDDNRQETRVAVDVTEPKGIGLEMADTGHLDEVLGCGSEVVLQDSNLAEEGVAGLQRY